MPLFLPPVQVKTGIELLGTRDGANPIFTTPDSFDPGTIEVYHNGRKLQIAPDGTDASRGEYFVKESFPGAGFDTVIFVSFRPIFRSELLASYVVG